MLTQVIHRLGRCYTRKICAYEFRTRRFKSHKGRSIEDRFSLQALGCFVFVKN
jgi:hypothetical protein